MPVGQRIQQHVVVLLTVAVAVIAWFAFDGFRVQSLDNVQLLVLAAGFCAIFAIDAAFARIASGQPVHSLLWACLVAFVAAFSIPATYTIQGQAITALAWATAFGVFAAVAIALALSTRERELSWQAWITLTATITAFLVTATLAFSPNVVPAQIWIYGVAVFVAISITVLLLTLNERVFERRQQILQRLLDKLAENRPGVAQDQFPALTLASIKYGAMLREVPARPRQPAPEVVQPRSRRWPLIMSSIAYMAFSVIGYVLLLVPTCTVLGVGDKCGAGWIRVALFWTELAESKQNTELINAVAVAGAAFLGAHIFTLRYLFKAALNSELNQFKWIRGALHMLTGVVVGLLLYRALKDTAWLKNIGGDQTPQLWLGVAFVAGWAPDFALTSLFRHLRVRSMKMVDDGLMKLVSIVPIEVIDGIDYDTRYRLEENDVVDVQNLATYNPITLYVETPYGLPEVFDWVLQAQLCMLVGPKAYFELKKIDIRTILQLEDEVAAGLPAYVRMAGNAMYAGATADRLKPITVPSAKGDGSSDDKKPKPDPAPSAAGQSAQPNNNQQKPGSEENGGKVNPSLDLDPECVKRAVATMCSDPYLIGLRRLWNYINAGPAVPAART